LWSILGGGTKMLAGAILSNSDQDIPTQQENCLKVFEGVWGNFLQKVSPRKKEIKYPDSPQT
jgi:hypothetical protein